GVHNAHIRYLTKDLYGGDESKIPVIEYFGGKLLNTAEEPVEVEGLTVSELVGKTVYRLSSASNATLPELDVWLQLLAGKSYSWRHAFFTTDAFVQGQRLQTNPMRRVFSPTRGLRVEVSYPNDSTKTSISVFELSNSSGKYVRTIEVSMPKDNTILVALL